MLPSPTGIRGILLILAQGYICLQCTVPQNTAHHTGEELHQVCQKGTDNEKYFFFFFFFFDGATARGGPWSPLQYASKPLDLLLCHYAPRLIVRFRNNQFFTG
jgi:hypothetical protein